MPLPLLGPSGGFFKLPELTEEEKRIQDLPFGLEKFGAESGHLLRQGKEAVAGGLEAASSAIGGGLERFRRGFAGPEAPGKVGGPSADSPWFKGTEAAAPAKEPTAASVPSPVADSPSSTSSIRAFKGPGKRITFTNQPAEYKGREELEYAAATASMRPEGKLAGGVSSPVIMAPNGKPTLMADPVDVRSRERELEAASHRAIMQRLQDQADPNAKIQRDLEAATKLAEMFTPSEEQIAAEVAAAFEIAKTRRADIPPEQLRAIIEQGVRGRVRDSRLSAIQEYLNKERYPGQTLSGYGAQLRGEAGIQ